MKPILKYPGAKWRIAEWITEFMPPHEAYVEPFFGSGGVFFNKRPARIETINDIDGAVVHFFRTCRERPVELAEAISLTPWAREEFLCCDFLDDAPASDDIERARQFAVRCWMTFGARTRCKTGWRHTTASAADGGPDNAKLWRRLPEIIRQVPDRLLDAQIENRDAVDVIRQHNGKNVLIYADPPYVKESRTLNGDQYRYEMSDQDHVSMLEALKDHKGMVLISGYDCEIYRDLLSEWHIEKRNVAAERGAMRTELLWMNRAVWECQLGFMRLDRMAESRE